MIVDVSSAVIRALSFIAEFQAAGAAMFLLLFARDVIPLNSFAAGAAIARRAASSGIVLVLMHQLLDAARLRGEFGGLLDASLQRLALGSASAAANALRIVGLLLIIAGLRHASSAALASSTPAALRAAAASRAVSVSAAAGGALVCATFLLVGHTSAHASRWLLAPLLLLHLVVMAGWFGALLPLRCAVQHQNAAQAATLVASFSRLATRLVPLIFVAGACIAIALLPGIAALRTSYGQLLIAKVAGFTILMLMAALNKWRLTPALARGEPRAARALSQSILAEWLLIAAVLSITAVLTTFYSPEG